MSMLAWSSYVATPPITGVGGYVSEATTWFTVVNWRSWLPLGIAGIIVWLLWIYRWVLSRAYRPTVNTFRASTSVVVPSFREDPDILMDCLETWIGQDPDELIIVPDIEDTEVIERLQARATLDHRIKVLPFQHSGKRSALGVGIKAARFDILVLVDSDTRWEPDLLINVQMPFFDPGVGAVSTRQNVYKRYSSIWRVVADWILDLRYYDYVPAMGRAGGVICVSGRTAVYRRSVVMPVLENLEHEFFLGRRCIAGDDGRLTWLVLASGYKTVFQGNARAMSMFPTGFQAFMKQRIRWSRNSYRTYLTAIWKGWIWKVPFVSQVTVLQILLTPVTMAATLTYLVVSRMDYTWAGVGLAVAWVGIGRLIRSVSHLVRKPADIVLLPVVVLTVICISLPIKTYALITMNKQGWLTRSADKIGGEGQNQASLKEKAGSQKPVGVKEPASVV